MNFFAILLLLICACSTIHCASTGGMQHTKGTIGYHTWKLASAQKDFDRASGEYKTAKAKEVPPGHEQAHAIDLTSKKSVARMYREKIKKTKLTSKISNGIISFQEPRLQDTLFRRIKQEQKEHVLEKILLPNKVLQAAPTAWQRNR